MKYTLERITAMSPKERRIALNNNKKYLDNKKFGEDAAHNVELISGSDLKLGPDDELRAGDWQLREIELIVNSPENEASLIAAADAGLPVLSAIEPLIVAKLGDEYKGTERRDPVQAGYLVGQRLYALGYEKIDGGDKKMPKGSIAKTAATFRKKKTAQ